MRVKNFEKIDRSPVSIAFSDGRLVTHYIEIGNESYDGTTDIFVITDDNLYSNVLYFRICWEDWKTENLHIKLCIVPIGDGRRAKATKDVFLTKSNIQSQSHFIDWVCSVCRQLDSDLMDKKQ